MSRYQHTKGQIKDNAIEALLHDPLFRQRVEKNKKGKEVICVKTNMKNGVTGRPVASKRIAYLPLAFLLLSGDQTRLFCSFNRSRISLSSTSSFVGAGAAAGSSFLRLSLLISLIAMKMANATITKSNTF